MNIVLVNPTLRQLRKAISQAQIDANGNMRTRTIGDNTISEWATDAKRTKAGRHSSHGGHVANAYKYPAYAAAMFCYWATDMHGRKHVWIVGHTVSAKKGSGVGHPQALPTREKLEEEKRCIEIVYPCQHITDGDIRRVESEDEKGFLRAIKKNHKDAAVRLVYADWLTEQGRTKAADTIRSIWMAPVATPTAEVVFTNEGEVVLAPQS